MAQDVSAEADEDSAPATRRTSTETAGAETVEATPGRRRTSPHRGVLANGVLDPKNNSLNAIRLVLSCAVLFSHSFPIAGRGDGPGWAGENLGGWAVIGFFVISGYLITGSRIRSDGARYLINRVARIMPGYIVCLVAVAFGFAPIAYRLENGTLDGFLTTPNTPANYVFANALLRISDYSVAGTLADAPHAYAWNGSLWSLYFEFLCYIVVGVAAMVPVFRRRAWPVIAMFALSVALHATMPTAVAYFGGNGEAVLLFKLLPYFLGGAVFFVFKEKLPLHWWAALPTLAVALGLVAWQPAWGGQLAAPLFAYVIMWVAAVLPSPNVVKVHDVSYGVYVYAFPVSQLLVLLDVHERGFALYNVTILALTLVLATISWLLVERPSMRLARGRRPFDDGRGHARPDQAVAPA